MSDIEKRLERIEKKLDITLEKLESQGNRITNLETQAGFFKLAFGAITAALAWVANKLLHI